MNIRSKDPQIILTCLLLIIIGACTLIHIAKNPDAKERCHYQEIARRFPPYPDTEFLAAVGETSGLFRLDGEWHAAKNATTWIGEKEELWRTPDLTNEWIIKIFENERKNKLYMIYRVLPKSQTD